MCLYPKLIKNRKYQINKKNGGNIPLIQDERTLYVPVGCGNCIECMKQKKREWQVRMLEDIKEYKNGIFVTLTFSNKSLIELEKDVQLKSLKKDMENEIATLAVRRMLERYRKKHKKSIRHWLVTELGHQNTERIHLHGIMYCDKEVVEKYWKYGQIWIGEYVNAKTVNYIVKYINKIDTDHKGYKAKILCSSGIGSGYLKRSDSKKNIYKENNTIEYYKTNDGNKLNLPKYYRNKLYSDEEKEKLWIKLLDKDERFVCGEKVSIKDNENDYYNVLEHYRMKNKRLGYGDDSDVWSRQQYLNNRNMLKSLKKYAQKKINK